MKVLLITPLAPFGERGACEKDRTQGILLLRELGHEIRVVTKIPEGGSPTMSAEAEAFEKRYQIPVTQLPYLPRKKSLSRIVRLIRAAGDGAAAEYFDPRFCKEVDGTIRDWKPDCVWVDYTFCYPVCKLARCLGVPTVMRSMNYEPEHFLSENTAGPWRMLKYWGKCLSEHRAINHSSVILSINPQEAELYRDLGAPRVINVPLRGLPQILENRNQPKEKRRLSCCFMASTYGVRHNYLALEFLVREIMPGLDQAFPGRFELHITGRKVPEDIKAASAGLPINLHGHVEDIDGFLGTMDLAIAPSLAGQGMQQKIFEPIARGIPTFTQKRGLAGYPFIPGEHVECFNGKRDLIESLGEMLALERRQSRSNAGRQFAEQLFSRQTILQLIQEGLQEACANV
jgi:hypothetical protein